MDLETYLKNNPTQYLVNPKFRIKYVQSLEEVNMALWHLVNEHYPNGIWRVSRHGDNQLCCYFGDSFSDALQALQTNPELEKMKLYNNY